MDTIRLRDGDLEQGGSTAEVVPGRGGLVTRFAVAAREVLFLDPATVADPAKNVRGGIPVLFPSPGKLAGDAWARGGDGGTLKQHGFARNLPWTVAAERADAVTMVLESDAATRAAYPWDFRVEMEVALAGRMLRLEQRVTNRSTRAAPMPFGFGFHPYFAVRDADKAGARIDTAATRAFDNVAKREIALAGTGGTGGGIDLTRSEVDLHLLDHGRTEATLGLAGGHEVIVRGSPEYTHWVVWTLAGRDFVCLEPWTAPGDALNTGDRLIELAAGTTRALWIEIEAR